MGKKFRTRDWNQLIVTIATVVFACTALVTVVLTLSSWRAGREAARPYLTFKESPLVTLKPQLNIELKFMNVGEHPTTNLKSKTVMMEQALTSPPTLIWKHSLVNDIPKNTTTSLMIVPEISQVNPNQPNLPAYYIVVFLQYEDPIIRKSYSQAIYLRWNGVHEGSPQPVFHIETEEKNAILEYFRAHQISPT